MEYSLYYLNKQAKLKDLKITEIIDKLNLIGFEVDDIFEESVMTNKFLNDTRLLIEIPSNRQDLLNEKLFLHEMSTIFMLEVYKIWKVLQPNYSFILNQHNKKHSKQIVKQIESSLNHILVYKFELENCFVKKSPLWIQQKLQNRGLESFNNLDDFLNLIILEYGSTITSSLFKENHQGYEIERSVENTKFNGTEIPSGSIFLKDKENQIICVLGVLNFIEDVTNKNTLSLEGFFYDIHENILDLKTINTQLSFKHLRSMFIENFQTSFKRLLTLIELYNENLIIKEIYSVSNIFNENIETKIIPLSKILIKKVLAVKTFDYDTFKKAGLRIIGETKGFFYIQIFNFRKDLARQIDLIEEYSRFIGYKNFQEILPKKELTYNPRKLNNYKFICNFFINYGFNEIFTNSLVSGISKTDDFSIHLENPLNSEINDLRSSLFPKLFEVLNLNLKSGFNNCNFFEIGRVFKFANNQIIEQDKIAGIFQADLLKSNKQKNLNWFVVKGFLELFLQSFGYENLETEEITNKTSYFHPTRSIHFKINDRILGTFGEVTPMIEEFRGLKSSVYIFEFNLNYFKNWRMKKGINTYVEYSKYPSVVRDLSFSIDKKNDLSLLKKTIKEGTTNLKSISFFDIYFDSISLEKLNLGVRVEFQSEERTLTTQEVDQQMKQLIENLKQDFNVEI